MMTLYRRNSDRRLSADTKKEGDNSPSVDNVTNDISQKFRQKSTKCLIFYKYNVIANAPLKYFCHCFDRIDKPIINLYLIKDNK